MKAYGSETGTRYLFIISVKYLYLKICLFRCSEWCNDKVRIAVLQKRKIFEQWLQQGTEQTFEEYREEKRRVKAVVREAKREAEDRFGAKLSQDFEGNRRMFWKEVNMVRK